MGHHLWGTCRTQEWTWCIPPGETALNFCLTLLAQEHCAQAQIIVHAQTWLKCPLRDHPVDGGAQPCTSPAYIPAHGSTEEEWQRGFHGVQAVRVWTSTSQSMALWPWTGHLTTQSLSFPIWKMKSTDLLLGLWGLHEILQVKQPGTKSDAECRYELRLTEHKPHVGLVLDPHRHDSISFIVSRRYGYSHLDFTAEKTEDQRSQVTCTKARS